MSENIRTDIEKLRNVARAAVDVNDSLDRSGNFPSGSPERKFLMATSRLLFELADKFDAALSSHSEHARHMVAGAAAGALTMENAISDAEAARMLAQEYSDDPDVRADVINGFCAGASHVRFLLAAQSAADARDPQTASASQNANSRLAEPARFWQSNDDGLVSRIEPAPVDRQGVALSDVELSGFFPHTHTAKDFLASAKSLQAAILSRASSSRAEVEIPEGYALVPKEPTEAINKAIAQAVEEGWMDSMIWYKALLAATEAPKAEKEK